VAHLAVPEAHTVALEVHTAALEVLMVAPADLSDTVLVDAVSEVAFITARTTQVFLALATTASSLKRQATTKNQMFLFEFVIGGISTRTNCKHKQKPRQLMSRFFH
jgi:hypothetical protein